MIVFLSLVKTYLKNFFHCNCFFYFCENLFCDLFFFVSVENIGFFDVHFFCSIRHCFKTCFAWFIISFILNYWGIPVIAKSEMFFVYSDKTFHQIIHYTSSMLIDTAYIVCRSFIFLWNSVLKNMFIKQCVKKHIHQIVCQKHV